MLLLAKRLSLIALTTLLTMNLAAPTARGWARFRVARTPGGGVRYGYRYGPGAGFYRPGLNNAYLRTSLYRTAGDIYGGYLSGAASAVGAAQASSALDPYQYDISTYGKELVHYQQSRLMNQQVQQAKIETRRKAFDEYLYERDMRPTTEDDREKARIENVRRAYNDPPITEIWSGLALNNLLDAIHKMEIQKGQGPTVPLSSELLRDINVTAGGQTGNLGPLKNGGKLQWPLVLRGSAYESERKRMNELAAQAFMQAQGDGVSPDTLDAMNKTLDRLTATLKEHVSTVSPNDYIQAKRYLNDLGDAVQALQDPKVANYTTGKWTAQGDTVSALVENMFRNGLRFGPASPDDRAAYNALHTAMVSYFTWPEKSWDPLAK
jgi:hypothetical protein